MYYRLLESIIKSELKTHGRFDLFIDDDIFNQTLIVLCLEIVLFAFSLHKELTTLLDCFKLEPFHFYKLIEAAISETTRTTSQTISSSILKPSKKDVWIHWRGRQAQSYGKRSKSIEESYQQARKWIYQRNWRRMETHRVVPTTANRRRVYDCSSANIINSHTCD